MDVGRKRTILIAASILAARRLAQLGPRPSPAVEACISEINHNAGEDSAKDRLALAGFEGDGV